MVENNGGKLSLTKFGDAMARYYIKLGTMQLILKMEPKASLSDVVSTLGLNQICRANCITAHCFI